MGVQETAEGLHIGFGDRIDGPYTEAQLRGALPNLPPGVQVWIDGVWIDLVVGLDRLNAQQSPSASVMAPDAGVEAATGLASNTKEPATVNHTYRYSARAATVASVLLGIPFLLTCWVLMITGQFVPVLLVIPLMLPAFPWVRRAAYGLQVAPTKVEQVYSVVARRVSTIEGSRVEGVETREGLLGRLLGYGYLVVTGTGGKTLKTAPVDDPAAVAGMIRALSASRQTAPAATMGDRPRPSTSTVAGLDEALRRLVRLREEGLLTESEFATQKSRLLAN